MAVDLENYAFSFSHAIIKANEKQYTAISNISFNQGVEREATYGTSRNPQKRSAGQLGMGEGSITFSDLDEGLEFYSDLGDDPSRALFTIDVTFANEAGATRSFELLSCALSGIQGDFENGAGAMSLELPFDFLAIKVDGREFAR